MANTEIKFAGKKIIFERTLSSLDRFVINFVKILEKHRVKYAVVSGYVAIVFGRSRNTEDVDILAEKLAFGKFKKLWEDIMDKYDCVNASDANSAYDEYLSEGCALRFSEKGKIIPNIEFKFLQGSEDAVTISEALVLALNKNPVRISPLEMQIAYKMYLGSDKDLEDAKFLYDLFNDNLNAAKLYKLLKTFKIKDGLIKRYLKGLLRS